MDRMDKTLSQTLRSAGLWSISPASQPTHRQNSASPQWPHKCSGPAHVGEAALLRGRKAKPRAPNCHWSQSAVYVTVLPSPNATSSPSSEQSPWHGVRVWGCVPDGRHGYEYYFHDRQDSCARHGGQDHVRGQAGTTETLSRIRLKLMRPTSVQASVLCTSDGGEGLLHLELS
jgi:hypothetical protein